MIFSINSSLISKERYFPNLGLENTLKYSEAISAEISKTPVSLAFFKTMPGVESSFNRALNNVLVSIIQN